MKQQLHNLLLDTYYVYNKKCRIEYSALGITAGVPRIMEALKTMDGCIQKELAEECGLTQPTISGILTKMEKNGFIRRVPMMSSDAKHTLQIFITDKGREIQDRIAEILDSIQAAAFDGIPEAEQLQLLETMQHIHSNIEKTL